MRLLQGNSVDVLKTLPSNSVQCCITSPPYYGLRSYLPVDHPDKPLELGLDETPDAYITRLVEVFREVRRVLRDDGTLFLNLGDSYAGGKTGRDDADKEIRLRGNDGDTMREGDIYRYSCSRKPPAGYKPKDLLGIPWMAAFALRTDGWYLRSDIIWQKVNPMPESVTDRPTKAHEYVFLLTKRDRYFYDEEAVREPNQINPNIGWGRQRLNGENLHKYEARTHRAPERGGDSDAFNTYNSGLLIGRNRRSVWSLSTKPYKDAHFATFPPELPRICMLAGTSEHGCCAACGAPYVRILHKGALIPSGERQDVIPTYGNGETSCQRPGHAVSFFKREKTTLGWQPSCACDAPRTPCVVLDPFNGAGTTGLVAAQLGREYIGIDLNAEYLAMSERRIAAAMPLFAPVSRDTSDTPAAPSPDDNTDELFA